MKRLLTIGLMLASAFALTNCAEEITAPVQDDITIDGNIENITPSEEEVDIPFEVFANLGESPETKTYNRGNGTYWHKYEKEGDAPSDQISVFHYDGAQFTHNNAFTIHDVATGLFMGSLRNKLGNTNDWYFLYPWASNYTINSSSGTTTITNVTIGAKVVNNVVPGSKTHISGDAYPMFGSIKGLGKETSPDIKMHHVAALVAIKLVNKTTGTIKIDDVEFGMPRIVSKDPLSGNKTIIDSTAILGSCKVNLTGENISTTLNESNVFSTTKACLKDTYDLKTEEEMIVYMAVSPVKTNGKTISIKVNGSQRTLKMTKDILNPGKVTTFKVDIKPFSKNATENLVSNAFDDEFTSEGEPGRNWKEHKEWIQNGWVADYKYSYTDEGPDPNNTHVGGKIVSLGTSNEIKNIKINGQSCSVAYKVGTASSPGTITIQGWAKDIINALPLSFYASALDNSPAAMTIHSVDLWIPEYNKAKKQSNVTELNPPSTTEYHRLKTRTHLKESTIGSLIRILNKADRFKDLKVTENGLERDALVAFVDPNTITFNGIPTNGYFSNNNIVVLREEDTHKSITPGLIDSFLGKKFSLDPNSPASFLGLVAMVNATKNAETGVLTYKSYTTLDNEGNVQVFDATTMEAKAKQTAEAIYNKIVSVLNNRIPSSISSLVSGENVINVIFESPTDLIHKVRDMKFKLVIQTYPYADTYPTTSTTYSPVILWEMNGTK